MKIIRTVVESADAPIRGVGNHARQREINRSHLYLYIMEDLGDRSWPVVRERLIDAAQDNFYQWRQVYRKSHLELGRSFERRVANSKAIPDLLKDERVSDERMLPALSMIYINYNDPKIARTKPPRTKHYKAEAEFTDREIRAKVAALVEAKATFRQEGNTKAAFEADQTAKLYEGSLTGRPRRRRRGRSPSRAGGLAEGLDAFLDEIPRAERMRMIARLLSEFVREYRADQVEELLRKRYQRKAKRTKSAPRRRPSVP